MECSSRYLRSRFESTAPLDAGWGGLINPALGRPHANAGLMEPTQPACSRIAGAASLSGSRECWCGWRSEEHTSELQSLMRISYAVFCLKKKTNNITNSE